MKSLIETTNIKRATKMAMDTISKCEIGVISGEPGMGKSTFKNLLVTRLEEKGLVTVYYCPFKKHSTQTNAILSSIYEGLYPEQTVPANENKKMRDIQKVIKPDQPLVLLIDNMQNLDLQTIKEIKVFWEELKNISILFFLKNDTKILHLLEKKEIGHRTNKYTFKASTPLESEKIAKMYGLEFEDDVTKKRFITICNGNPLSIQYYANLIKEDESYKEVATFSLVSKIEINALNQLRLEYNISIRDIEDRMKADGKDASRGFIGNAMTGKIDVTSTATSKGGATVIDTLNTARKMIEERQKGKSQ
jgi:hypothetical protein